MPLLCFAVVPNQLCVLMGKMWTEFTDSMYHIKQPMDECRYREDHPVTPNKGNEKRGHLTSGAPLNSNNWCDECF